METAPPILRHRKALLTLAALLLAALALWSLRAGALYVVQFRVHSHIDQWYAAPDHPPAASEVNALENDARSALAWAPADPAMLDALGRLYYYHATAITPAGQQRNALLHKAAACFRKLIAQRPAWPYGYAGLLSIKAELGEYDAEQADTLLHLIRLGPWDNAILPSLLRWSMWSWPFLPDDKREPVRHYLQRVAEQRQQDMRQTLEQTGGLAYYCIAIAAPDTHSPLCD